VSPDREHQVGEMGGGSSDTSKNREDLSALVEMTGGERVGEP